LDDIPAAAGQLLLQKQDEKGKEKQPRQKTKDGEFRLHDVPIASRRYGQQEQGAHQYLV
jgi:hypothetical protein